MTKKDEILKKLCQKAATKQAVYRTTKEVFEELKVVLNELSEDLDGQLCTIDKHVQVEYKDKGEFEAELRFSEMYLFFISTVILFILIRPTIYGTALMLKQTNTAHTAESLIYIISYPIVLNTIEKMIWAI